MKIKKKKILGGVTRVERSGGVVGGRGRVGGGGGGVRVDVNEELKFLCKLKKKWGGQGDGVGGSGWMRTKN